MIDTAAWEKVKNIFSSALELEPDRRPAFVVEKCGGDETLKKEVESWLASYGESEDFISTPLLSTEKIFSNGTQPAAGRRFGNYTIIREIGFGGMGAVYLAKRTDGEFEQQVALKIVRQSISESHMIERFRSERQILASLNHANIAKLLDGGVSESGEPFLAMEYVEGDAITEYVRRIGASLNDTLRLFLKVCSAVSYAHRNLIVHRDIKPGNILVANDGEPKLLDFGLAKLINTDLSLDAAQTQTAFRALTPAYASPEQLRGDPVTTSSDIYSLGIVLYELLTNERPFHFEGKSLDEIIRTVTKFEPSLPSVHSTSGNNNLKLRGDLDNIVLMALRKEPERRYQSVETFADDIERHLSNLPVSARPNTYKYRSSKFIKRHKVGVIAATLIFFSLIGAIAVSLWQTRQAGMEKAKAQAVSAFMQTMLNASSPDNSLRNSGRELTVKDVLDDASRRLAAEDLSSQPEVKAELQRIIGASYLSLGQYDPAEQNLNAALELQTRVYGEDHLETLETMVMMASLWVNKGDLSKADGFYRRSLPHLRSALKNGTIKPEFLSTSLADFALVRRVQGDSREAEILLREALSLGPQLPTGSTSNLGIQEAVLALTLADQGKFNDAEKIIKAKVESIRQKEGSGPIELGVNLTGLGSFQMEQGNLSEALKNLGDGEAIYRKLFDRANLQLGDNLRLQAQTLYLESRYTEAESKIDETLQIYRAGMGSQFVNYPMALMIRGQILSRTNRRDEAEKLIRESVKLRTENLPPAHFLLAAANGALGEFLTDQKHFAEAEPILLSSYESLKASQEANSPRLALARVRLISLYQASGKPERAVQYSN